MKTIKVTKTYRGCIELRDYDVQSAIRAGRSIQVVLNGDSMILSPEDLDQNVVMTSKPMKSKMSGGKDYRLLGYLWNPESKN
jgi:hypothetical protein